MEAVLGALASSRVAILGTGQHTIDLLPTISRHACVAAFIDEDPARTGATLEGLSVLSAHDAAAQGITDVVVSSWLYHDSIMARAASFERMGLRLHALYGERTGEAQRLSAGSTAA